MPKLTFSRISFSKFVISFLNVFTTNTIHIKTTTKIASTAKKQQQHPSNYNGNLISINDHLFQKTSNFIDH